MRVLITGGCGFIGSAVCRRAVSELGWTILNIDALTYAANPENVSVVADHPGYRFLHADVADSVSMSGAFAAFRPDAVIHLAAESHVDRSITGSEGFVRSNIVGTHVMLEAARGYWSGLNEKARADFRFLHVSTDEVYGSLGNDGQFTETTPYDPRSPYAASKAAADHLVSAWNNTYALPTLITNCSNNYGPYQFPEKLIPLVMLNALQGQKLPVYGDVDRHVPAPPFRPGQAGPLRCGADLGRGGRRPATVADFRSLVRYRAQRRQPAATASASWICPRLHDLGARQ